ncbi:MAG: hypothetical protein WBE76_11240 [Terracidiphilus sp.]
MNRPFLTCVLIAFSSGALLAQQSSQQNPYQGTSNPPANDAIVTDEAPPAKPPAGHPMNGAPAQTPDQAQAAPAQDQTQDQVQGQAQDQAQPNAAGPSANNSVAGPDLDSVAPAPANVAPPAQPTLEERNYVSDPDGDIVHPQPLQPGEIADGTTIRVELLDRLSTTQTEQGEPFRSKVASDVMEGGQVLIPAGAEIDGTVAQVSSGHPGGTGSMRLLPETVILADGNRFRLHAEVTGTPDSNTHVVGEGTIKPDSRWRRDSIEYGGAVGAGAVTGAVIAGPVGALTGGLVGAGVITTHLLRDHPQATLEPGATLLFTLTEPLFMSAPAPSGN